MYIRMYVCRKYVCIDLCMCQSSNDDKKVQLSVCTEVPEG